MQDGEPRWMLPAFLGTDAFESYNLDKKSWSWHETARLDVLQASSSQA